MHKLFHYTHTPLHKLEFVFTRKMFPLSFPSLVLLCLMVLNGPVSPYDENPENSLLSYKESIGEVAGIIFTVFYDLRIFTENIIMVTRRMEKLNDANFVSILREKYFCE